jgi:hypothetical protein
MREIRQSGLTRGKEVGGHCLCALIPWLPSILYSDTFTKDSQLRDILQCSKLQQPFRKFNSILSMGKSPVNIPYTIEICRLIRGHVRFFENTLIEIWRV